jgi:hypothetical protein
MEGDMKKLKLICLVILPVLATMLLIGCERYTQSDEINSLIKKNDLSLNMKAGDYPGSFTMEKISESGDSYCLKIDVLDTCSLRGESPIKPGKKYKLSFTMKNIDASPVINYSFWEKPETSLRHYTLQGENGNPPSSKTREVYENWTTFEEVFETRQGEDSFMLTLHSGKGTFYIREINIELIP